MSVAETMRALSLPLLRLHRLNGELKGLPSVTVRANLRIICGFDDGDCYDVDPMDYQ